MAEPARQLPQEDTADISPDIPGLRALEGGGETSEPRRGHLSSASDNGEQGAGGLFNPDGDSGGKVAPGPAGLAAAETAGGLYNPVSNLGWGGIAKRVLKIGNRKSTAILGGTAGTILVVLFTVLSLNSGPLEFIHLAQLLQRFHFSSNQNTQDSRLTKIARFIREPGKAERSRMGILGNTVADKLEARMIESGFESKYSNGVRYFEGYTINPDNKHFKDKTPSEIRDKLINEHGIDPQHIKTTVYKGKPTIEIDASKMGYLEKQRLIKNVLENTHMQKITAAAGARIMGTRGAVTWHPIKKLSQKVLQDLADRTKAAEAKKKVDELRTQWRESMAAYFRGGVGTVPTAEDKKAAADKAAGNPVEEKASLDIKNKLAKGTDILAIGCMVKGASDSVTKIRHDLVILPLIRLGVQAISLGNQVMSNQNIDMHQLGFFKEQLDKVDKNGNQISTWSGAKSIQYELGQKQSGPDIKSAGKVGKGNPFDWINSVPGIGPGCDALNSPIGQAGQVILAPVAGAIGLLLSHFLLGPMIDDLVQTIAGKGIDPLASGADFGNNANYGARMAANDQAAAAGGVALTGTQESQLKTADAAINKDSFQSHSIAYRVFNPYDSNSLMSHIIDQQNPNVTQNVANMATSFVGIFSAALRIPGSLLTGHINAATANASYDYGFPKYGFRPKEEDSAMFKDPFDNARKVVPILDADWAITDPPHPLITKAEACFGVIISPTGGAGGTWDVQGGRSVTDLYNGYDKAGCDDKSETWKRIRYFILDTEAMKSNACYFGDEQSCTDIGFGGSNSSSGASTTQTTASGSLPTGTAKELATQLKPFVSSGKVKCLSSGCPDIINTANGTSIKGGSGCLVDALNPGVLGMLLKLAQMGHTFILSALCSDHHNDGLRGHSGGRAADFNTIDGVFMGPNDTPWDSAKLAAGKKLDQDIASFMPKSTGFGQVQCHPTFSFLSGFSTFNDTCHHQHIQVES